MFCRGTIPPGGPTSRNSGPGACTLHYMTGAANEDPIAPGEARNEAITDLRRRIRDHWDSFGAAGRAVCRSLAESSAEHLLFMSALDLGQESRTSNATVIRTLQSLGYSG